jgi:ADP-dependent NAD(P)H-hydrate dehydratase / NAD(P)H-hydrate epimerase
MKIFTSEQVRQIDKYTIENEPIASINLMERAAQQITGWLTSHYDQSHSFAVFSGPGNNGGDGLAAARMLLQRFYNVTVYMIRISDKLSPDAKVNYERLKKLDNKRIFDIHDKDRLPVISETDIILDAIFGSGLSRPSDGFTARVIKYLNSLTNIKIAIDIPSGLFGEDNAGNLPENIIKADVTLTIQFPPISFFFAENEQYIGKWEVLPIGLASNAIHEIHSPYKYVHSCDVKGLLKKRNKFSHKGTYGNVLLIAGSYGMMGAAVLAARAALRAGSGLVTVHLPGFGYQIVQTAIPEALISMDESDLIFSSVPELAGYNSIGIGPGLGSKINTQRALFDLLKKVKVPVVIDADGLNILSANKEWLHSLPPATILTPHPKEFDRLAGKSANGYERNQMQMEFARKYNVIVVLKGAYTSIALPDGTCYFNSTGNAGMATAGSGDVLTGIILSLLGQGYIPAYAALVGVYLHGLAGDFAARKGSEESMIASDIIENIGKAYRTTREA